MQLNGPTAFMFLSNQLTKYEGMNRVRRKRVALAHLNGPKAFWSVSIQLAKMKVFIEYVEREL